jgi:hypothetical protein
MICPFCQKQNVTEALVCASCSRDIAVPLSLMTERDELVRKRDAIKEELLTANREILRLKGDKKRRLS